jgi:hypothetical protein
VKSRANLSSSFAISLDACGEYLEAQIGRKHVLRIALFSRHDLLSGSGGEFFGKDGKFFLDRGEDLC